MWDFPRSWRYIKLWAVGAYALILFAGTLMLIGAMEVFPWLEKLLLEPPSRW